MSSRWTDALVRLAAEFKKAEREENSSSWRAAIAALAMRRSFPARAAKGEPSWTEFCREVLGRPEKRVWAYYTAAAYCDEFVPGWRQRVQEMPPYYLVADLSSIRDRPGREHFHSILFGNEWGSVREFRMAVYQYEENFRECHGGGGSSSPPSERAPDEKALRLVGRDEAIGRVPPGDDVPCLSIEEWSNETDLATEIEQAFIASKKLLRSKGALVWVAPRGTKKEDEDR